MKLGYLLCRFNLFVQGSEHWISSIFIFIFFNLFILCILFRAGGGKVGQYQGSLPSTPQQSSSHLDTMQERGTEARRIAEGRVFWSGF